MSLEVNDIFINQCQYIVKNGWNDNIKDIDDKVDFFSGVLNPLLVNPAKHAFKNKKISEDGEKVIMYFTRLALFRLLFDVNKIKHCIEHSHAWFSQMKSNLDKEFASL